MNDHDPWFRFFADDFLGSEAVVDMSAEARGLYICALALDWRSDNGIPDDPVTIAKLARLETDEVARVWPAVRACFVVRGDGRLTNERLNSEREFIARRRAELRQNGRKGGTESAKRRRLQSGSTESSSQGTAPLESSPSRATAGPLNSHSLAIADTEQQQDKEIKSEREQQEETAVVDFQKSFSVIVDPVSELTNVGVEPGIAEKLARDFPDETRRQLEVLPYLKRVNNPPAFIVRAIQQKYPVPARIAQDIESGRELQEINRSIARIKELPADKYASLEFITLQRFRNLKPSDASFLTAMARVHIAVSNGNGSAEKQSGANLQARGG